MFSRIEMYGALLRENPVEFIVYMAYTAVVFLLSLILHECAHGWMALRCGDPTAKMLGRLSLNPARHLDPIGTICMFLFGFGWAKPVPVNPRNFRDYRRDDFLVSIAGIVVNLSLFIVCAALAVILNHFIWTAEFHEIIIQEFGDIEMMVNPYYGWALNFGGNRLASAGDVISNGHAMADIFQEYIQHGWLLYFQRFLLMMVQVNLVLAIFNLLPIPPLDGFHVLNDTILKGRFSLNQQTFQIGQIIVMVLMATNALDTILTKGCQLISGAVFNVFLMIAGIF